MKRKIDRYLQEWKAMNGHKPLVVKGARQVGKTYSIRQFGSSYSSFIEINFITHPEYKAIFSDGFSVEAILRQLSFVNPQLRFMPNDTLIFFDEMQEYPNCATSLKFFHEDGRYDVVCSGSLMGINYSDITSNSVGYKTDFTLYSLDFEEFLWAHGYTDEQIGEVFSHLVSLIPFTQLEMDTFFKLFLSYIVVGGMPEIVANYVATKNFSDTLGLQRQLLTDYEQDITKYAVGIDKAKIRNVYRHIPVFLSKENKKFQITKVAANANNRSYAGCVDWLRDAGIVNICHCLHLPELPLKGNYDESKYKLYYHDSGLLIGALDDEAGADLRRNQNFGVYKGAIYENVVAEALVKSGFQLYYYQKENAQLEMDFFIRNNDNLIPIEVKAKDGATMSLNRLIQSDSFPDIRFGVKLCRRNVGFNGKFYTIPYFCAFLLKRWVECWKK